MKQIIIETSAGDVINDCQAFLALCSGVTMILTEQRQKSETIVQALDGDGNGFLITYLGSYRCMVGVWSGPMEFYESAIEFLLKERGDYAD